MNYKVILKFSTLNQDILHYTNLQKNYLFFNFTLICKKYTD